MPSVPCCAMHFMNQKPTLDCSIAGLFLHLPKKKTSDFL